MDDLDALIDLLSDVPLEDDDENDDDVSVDPNFEDDWSVKVGQ